MPKHGSGGSFVLGAVLDFCDKKKVDIPPALRKACPDRPPESSAAGSSSSGPASESAEFKWALTLLAGLKERERRALARFVDKRAADNGAQKSEDKSQAACSDGEDGNDGPEGPPLVRGGEWPAEVRYTNNYHWGEDVPPELRAQYRPARVRQRAARPCRRTFSARITEPSHPAVGENGLFAAIDLPCGAWVIDYVGAITLGANEDRSSDYVCDFGEKSELALDAKTVGNEARFVNDYRNTGKRASVEFRLRRDALGEMRQGVFVCAKEGVTKGEELLISCARRPHAHRPHAQRSHAAARHTMSWLAPAGSGCPRHAGCSCVPLPLPQ